MMATKPFVRHFRRLDQYFAGSSQAASFTTFSLTSWRSLNPHDEFSHTTTTR
jgi:hypothetical protein